MSGSGAAGAPLTFRRVLGTLGRLALTLAAGALLVGVARIAPFMEERPTVRGTAWTKPGPESLHASRSLISIEGAVCAVEEREVTDCAAALDALLTPGPDGFEPQVLMDERGPDGGHLMWVTGMPAFDPAQPLPDFPPEALTYHVAEATGCGGACPGRLRHYAYAADTSPAASAPSAASGLPMAPLVQRIGWFEAGGGVAMALDRTDDLPVTLEVMDVLLREEGWRLVPAQAGGTSDPEGVAGTYARNGSVLMLVPDHDLEGDLLLTIRQGPGA